MHDMLAVIRMRGSVRTSKGTEDTLKMLRLHRKMHCVLLTKNDSYRGMLQLTKDFITWGEISDIMLEKLVLKRGRKAGNNRLTSEEIISVITALQSGAPLSKLPIKPVFRLSPPSGGFKHGIKHAYPKGELGNRKEKINELLEKMI